MNTKYLGLFITIIFLNFLSFSTYGLPIAFFPKEAKNRGISAFVVGIIFSMYPLGGFIFGFIVGKMLNTWRRERMILYSQLLMGISIVIFGLANLISGSFFFIIITLITRAMQGISIGTYQTVAYSYIPDYWADEIDIRISILEIFVGLGIGSGPLIGTLFYETIGYLAIYLFPGIFIMVFGSILAYLFLPWEPKHSEENYRETLSIRKSFRNKDMLYTFFCLVINLGGYTLIMPELENKVIELGGTAATTSVILTFNQLGYIIGISFLLYYKCENRTCLFFGSTGISVINLVILGLDCFININNFLMRIIIALALFSMGVVNCLTMIPNVSQNLLILQKIFPNKQKVLIDNMASGIFTSAIALAEFNGPILGGILCDLFGFSFCCIIYSGITFLFVILYGFDGKAFKVFMIWMRSKNINEPNKNAKIDVELKLLEQRN